MSGSLRVRAPGRVNLIGEHTDYSGGLAMPVAIDREILLTGHTSDRIRLSSDRFSSDVDIAADGQSDAGDNWGRYVAAVARELDAVGRRPVGITGELRSSIPDGAGLSSSAALEVAVALALCHVAEFELPRPEIARLAQRAEHRAVDVPVGVLDQAAVLLADAGHALLLDCDTLEHELVPLPTGHAVVVIDSNTPRRLEDSGYAQRRTELEKALGVLGGRSPKAVAAAELPELTRDLPPVLARRLRHVVTENERVRATAAVLRTPEPASAELGRLFAESHASLRDDYEVSTPELDTLVELARQHGAVAARLTGGGFGGAIVTLVPEAAAQDVGDLVARDYARRHDGRQATVHVCHPAPAASVLD